MNEWSHTSTSLIRLYVLHRGNFTLDLTCDSTVILFLDVVAVKICTGKQSHIFTTMDKHVLLGRLLYKEQLASKPGLCDRHR
jgi:hypothetical protein